MVVFREKLVKGETEANFCYLAFKKETYSYLGISSVYFNSVAVNIRIMLEFQDIWLCREKAGKKGKYGTQNTCE